MLSSVSRIPLSEPDQFV